MNLIILGPPGAGKGTQAKRLAQGLGIKHLSSGDMLRAEKARGTQLGVTVARYMDAGEFVPDDIMMQAILPQIVDSARQGVLLDGFPRTVTQAESLDQALQRVSRQLDSVLELDVPKTAIVKRITGRRVCPQCNSVYHTRFRRPSRDGHCDDDGEALIQRPDDTESVIVARLDHYESQTKLLTEYYLRKGLLRSIDGDGEVDQVYGRLLAVTEEVSGGE